MEINSFEELINYLNQENDYHNLYYEINQNIRKYLDLCNDKNIIDFINIVTKKIPSSLLFPWFYSMVCNSYGFDLFYPMTKDITYNNRFYLFFALHTPLENDEYPLKKFIDSLISNNEINYICNNIEQIINSHDIDNLIQHGILNKIKEIAPEKFKTLHTLVVTKLAYPASEAIDDRTINALTLLVEEISENEKTDISELKKIGSGHYSNAYKLGNKVIKFGENRETHTIPYHRRILQPLIRRQISSDYSPIFIEISEYLEPDKSINSEDVYAIYKELRDDGIVWTDPRVENIGRLQKENIIHFNETLYVDDYSVGFNPTRLHDTPLQSGKLVIIDSDLLYQASYFDCHKKDCVFGPDFYLYETRYQRERRKQSKIKESSGEMTLEK